jgi:hypothetical protein
VVSEDGPGPRQRRWHDIKTSVFTIAVTVTILAAAAFVVITFLDS